MTTNVGRPCFKCKVGFYLEIKTQSPRTLNCYNCKHPLLYIENDNTILRCRSLQPISNSGGES